MAQRQVYIGKILTVSPIPDADRIEAVEVICGAGGKWRGVVHKGQFQPGDSCQVYLPDSLLPTTPEFAFMEKYGYRVRMARLRGVPSEVLVWPQTIDGQIGADVTDQAGVMKYEKPVPMSLNGDIAGNFPAFIPKTDEPHFQGVPEMVQEIRDLDCYATIKLDGSSGTVFQYEGRLGVCSRNWELKDTPGNLFWHCVKETRLQHIPNGFAVQFEAVGPGIQGNPAGFQTVQPFAFQVYDIDQRRYLDALDYEFFCVDFNIPSVERIASPYPAMFADDALLLAYAEGSYANGRPREGVVIRPVVEQRMPLTGDRLSFKVINLQYKER